MYGGAAGSGKSAALILEAARLATVAGAGGIVFRRNSTQLTGAGSLWEEAMKVYSRIPGAKFRQAPQLEWRFPNGSTLEFRHLQYETDVYAHQGKSYALVLFDELTHFSESQFFYLLSRMRSTSGMRPTMRATCNPDPDSFVRKLISWWLDEHTGYAIPERAGKIRWMLRERDEIHWADSRRELRERFPHITRKPLSFAFVPARLTDNPALLKHDPDYGARLESLSFIERSRLLDGNWNIRAAAGLVFKREWFEIVDKLPDDVERTCRGWDLAATEPSETNRDPDWTRGCLLSKAKSGIFYVRDVVGLRGRAKSVDELIKSTAKSDGNNVTQAFWQDPGSAGKSLSDHHVRMLAGYDVRVERASKDKLTYAKPASAQAEHRNIKLLRASWNDEFLRELEAFDGLGKVHDDAVDALSRAFLQVAGKQFVPAQDIDLPGL